MREFLSFYKLGAVGALWVCLCSLLFAGTEDNETLIVIDTKKVSRVFKTHPIGININVLMDSESKRLAGSRNLVEALKELGVTTLRFPEGELGDAYLWATPPFPAKSAPAPKWSLGGPQSWPSSDSRFSTADFKPLPDIMSFDTFMEICLKTKSDPIIIVTYDAAYKSADKVLFKPTLDELKTSAVEWVRYANITNKWGIRYWEIGNETDMHPETYGGADPGAKQYALDVVAFSKAMKEVDPSIKIGINVFRNIRLAELLKVPELWRHVDYISLHNYPTYGWSKGYETFRSGKSDFAASFREADSLIAASDLKSKDKERLEFLVTETNAFDWDKIKGWKNQADLGHCLVNFDIIGQTLSQPRVQSLQQWVTRWIDNNKNISPYYLADSLTQNNRLTPMGHSVAIWANHIGENLLTVKNSNPSVIAYASAKPSAESVAIFLLNKELIPTTVALSLKNFPKWSTAETHVLTGENPESPTVTLKTGTMANNPTALKNVMLPALSITVIKIQ